MEEDSRFYVMTFCICSHVLHFKQKLGGKQAKLLAKSGITRCHALVYVILRSQNVSSGCELDSVSNWCSGSGILLKTMFQSVHLKFLFHSLSGRRKKNLSITLTALCFGEKLCTFLLISSSSTFYKTLVLSLILLKHLPANLSCCRYCRSTVRLLLPCLISRIT